MRRWEVLVLGCFLVVLSVWRVYQSSFIFPHDVSSESDTQLEPIPKQTVADVPETTPGAPLVEASTPPPIVVPLPPSTKASSTPASSTAATHQSASSQHIDSSITTLGTIYNDQACQLVPGWGISSSPRKNLTKDDKANLCLGKEPTVPTTPATYLTCHANLTTTTATATATATASSTHSKPILSNRSHPGVTVALLYFAKPALLLRQLQEFASYPKELQEQLTLLIVDDGSPPGIRVMDFLPQTFLAPQQDQLQQQQQQPPNKNASAVHVDDTWFRIRLARIVTERDWNIGGARNLAFYLSDTPRTLLLDLDILVPVDVMQAALSWDVVDPTTHKQLAHRFNRRKPDNKTNVHPAVSILSTDAYWNNGGCDEDFCGNYGYTDVHFWFRWKMDVAAKEKKDHLDVYLQEYELPGCDTAYLRNETLVQQCKDVRAQMVKAKRNLKRNHAVYKTKTKQGCWSNNFLRFEWMLEWERIP